MSEPGVASPCIDMCRLDAQGTLCMGCWRTLDEITAWRDLDDGQRRAVMDAVELRRMGLDPSLLPGNRTWRVK